MTPADAGALLAAGFDITVEASGQRCFTDADYRAQGCRIAAPGSWVETPPGAFVLGLKELPESDAPLAQAHIYFAHAFKQQAGWQHTLRRFKQGGGCVYDLEYLVNERGRRIAAFGYWAGYAGAAVAIKAWCGQQLGKAPALGAVSDYPNRAALREELAGALAAAGRKAGHAPRVIVLGALGRSGRGASDCASDLGLAPSRWDLAETHGGGPFPEILQHDIFINCVLLQDPIPPFVTGEAVAAPGRRLSVISDVSCDPGSRFNPVPLYHQPTTFDRPALRLAEGLRPLDLIAIDHLPAMLPSEASQEFSGLLLPALHELGDPADAGWPRDGVWQRAREVFEDRSSDI